MRRPLLIAGLAAVLALTSCSGKTDSTVNTANDDRSYDVSGIQTNEEIAAMLPENIKESGKLVIGAAIDYAPAEFRADDLQTAIGYDVDLGKALGKVLGVQTEVSDAEFASLLPGIGTKYNIGISSFSVTPERTENYNMVSYIEVGSSYAVKKGNPEGFDPENVCGQSIGVQTGTYQEEQLADFSAQCEADGKDPVDVVSYGVQSDVTTNVAGGKIIAMFADSTVADYSVALTNDQLEVIGGIRDAAPQGIVVAKDDQQLTEAIQAAMQELMDDGTWNKILSSWGVSDEAALSTAQINPEV